MSNNESEKKQSQLKFIELVHMYDKDKENQIKTATKTTNKSVLEVLGELHNLIADDITDEYLIENVFEDLVERCSIPYTNKIRAYINKVYAWGIKKKKVSQNPIDVISTFKNPDAIHEEVQCYTPYEWDKWDECFKKHLRDYPRDFEVYFFLNMIYFMGMRTGEVRAITLHDIQVNHIRINKIVTPLKKSESPLGYKITGPKTKRSYRTIEMPTLLANRMKLYYEYLKNRGRLGRKLFLFGGATPICPERVRRKFQYIAAQAGIPRYKPYSLRHSHASILINGGALDHAVAKRLGHTVKELRETYAHLFKTSEDNCVNVFNDVYPVEDKRIRNIDVKAFIEESMSKNVQVLGFTNNEMEWGTYYHTSTDNTYVQLWTFEHDGSSRHMTIEKSRFPEIKSSLAMNL